MTFLVRRRWENNINIDLKEVGCDARNWMNLAQDRDQFRAYVVATGSLKPNQLETLNFPQFLMSIVERLYNASRYSRVPVNRPKLDREEAG